MTWLLVKSLVGVLALTPGLMMANAQRPPGAPLSTAKGTAAIGSTTTHLRIAVPLEPSAPFDHALEDLAKEFNSTHSHVQVELIKSGSSFQNLRNVIAAHYANDLPDLAMINTSDLPTLTALHIVQPLPTGWYSAKKFLPGALSALKCPEGPCSMPFQRKLPVWFFNRELLFKMNQDTSKIPAAWGKLAALSQKLSKQGELWALAVPKTGDGAISRWTALGMPTTMAFDSIADWIAKTWQIPSSWLPGTPSTEEATRLFLEQKAVILLGSLDQMPFLKSNAAFRFGTALPDGELGWFGTDFVVLAKGKNGELAREFLDFIYRPEVLLTLFRSAYSLPVIRLQTDTPAWRKELDAEPVIKTALTRKFKPLGLDKIVPQSRDEFAATVWESIEQPPEANQRSRKSIELRARFQKKLSTNSH